MKILCDHQYDDEWWKVRRGKPTASEFGSIIVPQEVWEVRLNGEYVSSHREERTAKEAAEKKNKKTPGHEIVRLWPQSEARFGYICQLIADVYDPEYGLAEEYVSKAMATGTLMEPEARKWYEFQVGRKVQQVGLVSTDDERFGCSPDSLVGDDGVLELKVPTPAIQVGYLIENVLPPKYRPQCHGHLYVTGREWCDFMSYSRGLPPLLVRVVPDDYTKRLGELLEEFWADYQAALRDLDLPEPVNVNAELPDSSHPW